jgi:allantoin racemase
VRILVVNPNTTESMTAAIGEACRAVAAEDTEVTAINPAWGPPSIETYVEDYVAAAAMLQTIAAHRDDYDAFVIACAGDPGLYAARQLTDAPVIGIGEAAFHMASLIAGKFSVVTTLARSVPAVEQNLVKYGLATRCAKVRASDIPVLDLEISGSDACERISAEIATTIREDSAEAIVLGCAGMADLALILSRQHGVPVLDGVACAVKLCEGLVAIGLKTSKSGSYGRPREKLFAGYFAEFSPRDDVAIAD